MTLAIITGGSTGIGLELARIARAEGHQAIIVADEPAVHTAAVELGAEAVEADLATPEGIAAVLAQLGGRDVDLLMLNAGTGMGHAFLDQDPAGIDHVVANRFGIRDGRLTGTLDGPISDGRAELDPLEELARRRAVPRSRVVAVGDGANDRAMVQAAGTGIAFRAKPALREAADVVIDGTLMDGWPHLEAAART